MGFFNAKSQSRKDAKEDFWVLVDKRFLCGFATLR